MGREDAPPGEAVGLCLTCRWMRVVSTRRSTTYFRCGRAESDARFPRYPSLPVRSCAGYEEAMLYVVLLHYTQPVAAVDAIRPRHIEHLERYAKQGVFHAWARRRPPTGGVLVATAPNRASLDAIVAEDPYVQQGVARAEVVEFNPVNVRGPLLT
jgi:uncharacterized protein YciI